MRSAMPFRKHVCPTVTIWALLVMTLDASPGVPPDRLSVDEYVEAYRTFDMARNGGMGHSESVDAAQLGWGESYVLADYMYLWRVTADRVWLRKVCEHADNIFVTMSDHDADGYSGWQTDRYSVALAEVEAGGAPAGLLDVQGRIADIKAAHAVTGHTYRVEFRGDGRYVVEDLTSGKRESHAVADGNLVGVPGVRITLDGAPKPGDVVAIRTTPVAPLEYLIHEGMLLYPIALFIEAVMADEHDELQADALRYLGLIRDNFVPKWDRCWVDAPEGRGAYTATDSPAERTPGRLLPHNQYAMHAQAYAVLDPYLPDLALAGRAEQMARNFRANVRAVGDAYAWNYWDWDGGHSGAEDSSHAAINVGLVVEGAQRGVVFDASDASRIARTLLDVMWNGSLTEPNVGDRVDTADGDTYFTLRRWAELAAYDPTVWDVCLAVFRARGEQATVIPTMLHAQKGLADE